MCCPNCRLSLKTLVQMQQDHTPFFTAGGRKVMWIAEVDERSRTIKMERSTKKITWSLDYMKLKEIHDQIYQGELMLDQYEIDKRVPT